MTELAVRLPGLKNATMAVQEWQGDVIFLHEVRVGRADRSYGVHVAKLAGLPERVVARAHQVLEALEKGERQGGDRKAVIDDLPLFAAAPAARPATQKGPSAVEQRLAALHPDEMTAREALALLYELKELAGRG